MKLTEVEINFIIVIKKLKKNILPFEKQLLFCYEISFLSYSTLLNFFICVFNYVLIKAVFLQFKFSNNTYFRRFLTQKLIKT